MNELVIKNAKWLQLLNIIDGFDGIISVANELANIPFSIKRVYFIHNLIKHQDVIRGKHAHKKLEQALFCINGQCNVLLDDGINQEEILLSNPSIGIYLGTQLWHTMYNFQNNCILLVVASDMYIESDYIRDYIEFKKYILKK